jgi:hypothetical protein
MSRKPLALLLVIAAALGLIAFVVYLLIRPTPGVVHSLLIHAIDGQTQKPVPLIIDGPVYATADPWQRQVTRISQDTIQIKWMERTSPAKNLLYSPGYYPILLKLEGRQWRNEITYRMWRDTRPSPPAPATQPASAATTAPTAN